MEAREPKVAEDAKRAIFARCTRIGESLNGVIRDLVSDYWICIQRIIDLVY
jgi:hypothetical protein